MKSMLSFGFSATPISHWLRITLVAACLFIQSMRLLGIGCPMQFTSEFASTLSPTGIPIFKVPLCLSKADFSVVTASSSQSCSEESWINLVISPPSQGYPEVTFTPNNGERRLTIAIGSKAKPGTFRIEAVRSGNPNRECSAIIELVESCSSCAAGARPNAGQGDFLNRSIDVRFALGDLSADQDAGVIHLKSPEIAFGGNANTSLMRMSQPYSDVLAIPFRERLPASDIVETGSAPNKMLSEVRTPRAKVSVIPVSTYQYELKFFRSISSSPPISYESSPYIVWVINNPNGAANAKTLEVTKVENGINVIKRKYEYADESGQVQAWTMTTWVWNGSTWVSAEGHKEVTRRIPLTLPDEAFEHEVHDTRLPANSPPISKTRTEYKTYSGIRKVSLTKRGISPKSQSTAYAYYSSGNLERVVHPDGGWEYYQYDSTGRITKQWRPWGDSPPPALGSNPDAAGANSGIKTEYSYAVLVPAETERETVDLSVPRRTVEYLPFFNGGSWAWKPVKCIFNRITRPTQLGTQNIKSDERELYDIEDTTPLNWSEVSSTALDNRHRYRRTVRERLRSGIDDGKISFIVNDDGTGSLYSYSGATTTIRTGAFRRGQNWELLPNETSPTFIEGTKTTTQTDSSGRTVSEVIEAVKVEDSVETVKAVIKNITRSYLAADLSGRDYDEQDTLFTPVRVTKYRHDCCGLSSVEYADGSVESYGYDDLKRRTSSQISRGGVLGPLMKSLLDPAGRLVSRTRGSSPAVTLESVEYDAADRSTKTWNALGGVTLISHPDDGGQVTTTTRPVVPGQTVGGTVTETRFRDGSIKRITGSASRLLDRKRDLEVREYFDGEITHYWNRVVETEFFPVIDGQNYATATNFRKTCSDSGGRPLQIEFPVYTAPSGQNITVPSPVQGIERFGYLTFNPAGGSKLLSGQDDGSGTAILTGPLPGVKLSSTDADGVTTLYAYDSQGKVTHVATDLNGDGFISSTFEAENAITTPSAVLDRVTRVTRSYEARLTGQWSVESALTEVLVAGTSGDPIIWNWEKAALEKTTISAQEAKTENSLFKDNATAVTTTTITTYPTTEPSKRVVVVTRPDQVYQRTEWTYGRKSNEKIGSPSGILNQKTFTYDSHDRLETETDTAHGSTTFAYNDADQVTSVAGPFAGDGSARQLAVRNYSSSLLLDNSVEPDGATTYSKYFVDGSLKEIFGGRQYPVKYEYDGQGRMTKMHTFQTVGNSGTQATTIWTYDSTRGFLKQKESGAVGSPVLGEKYVYTPAGRLRMVIHPRVVVYGGLNTSIVTKHKYGFDIDSPTQPSRHGDVVEKRPEPEMAAEPYKDWFEYDSVGRLKVAAKILNANNVFNQTTDAHTTYGYNNAGAVTVETSRNGIHGLNNGVTITRTQDAILRPQDLKLEQSIGVTTTTKSIQSLTYDSYGRLATSYDTYSPQAERHHVTFGYAANSRLLATTTTRAETSGGAVRMTVARKYDKLDRLTEISSKAGSSTSAIVDSHNYEYNGANQRTRRFDGDESVWVYDYDSLGQLKSGKRFWADGTPVAQQQFTYLHDDIGNRKESGVEATGVGTLAKRTQYFPSVASQSSMLNQFTRITSDAKILSIWGVSKDSLGAVSVQIDGGSPVSASRRREYFWLDKNDANDAANSLQTVGVTAGAYLDSSKRYVPRRDASVAYDANGNLSNDERWTYTWDSNNRLIKMVSLLAAGTVQALTFEYDHLGRRVRKCEYSNTAASVLLSDRLFVYDGWNLIAEFNGTSKTLAQSYYWGDIVTQTDSGLGGIGCLLAIKANSGGTHFPGYDGNGNVSVLVGLTDLVTANYEYGPFGELLRVSGPAASLNPFRWSSKFCDSITDLVYYGYRYYNPSHGRWLSRDPIGVLGGDNEYCFVSNDSVNGVDALGLKTTWQVYQQDREFFGNDAISRRDDYLLLYSLFYGTVFSNGVKITDRPLTVDFFKRWLNRNSEDRQLSNDEMGPIVAHLEKTLYYKSKIVALGNSPGDIDYKNSVPDKVQFVEGDLFSAFHEAEITVVMKGCLKVEGEKKSFTGSLTTKLFDRYSFNSKSEVDLNRTPFNTVPGLNMIPAIANIKERRLKALEDYGYTTPFNVRGETTANVTLDSDSGILRKAP